MYNGKFSYMNICIDVSGTKKVLRFVSYAFCILQIFG